MSRRKGPILSADLHRLGRSHSYSVASTTASHLHPPAIILQPWILVFPLRCPSRHQSRNVPPPLSPSGRLGFWRSSRNFRFNQLTRRRASCSGRLRWSGRIIRKDKGENGRENEERGGFGQGVICGGCWGLGAKVEVLVEDVGEKDAKFFGVVWHPKMATTSQGRLAVSPLRLGLIYFWLFRCLSFLVNLNKTHVVSGINM